MNVAEQHRESLGAQAHQLGWPFLVMLSFLLALAGVLGSLSAILALLASLAFVPQLFRTGGTAAALDNPAMIIFLSVNLALLVAFSITATTPADVRYIGNFVPLLLAIPLYAAGKRRGNEGVVAVLADFALAGAALAALVALYDVFIAREPRAAGWFSTPNLMPRVALLLGFIAPVGVLGASGRRRLLYWLGPICGAVAALLSDSRGAQLGGVALTLSTLTFWAFNARNRRIVLVLIVPAVVAILALLLVLGPALSARAGGLGRTVFELLSGNRSALDTPSVLRLDMLDAFLAERLSAAPEADATLAHVMHRLRHESVSATAEWLGWSRKRLASWFSDCAGILPRQFCRIARFERFSNAMQREPHLSLAALACDAGYADQAHLSHDVRSLTGMTPGALRGLLLPAEGGVRD